MNAPILDRFSRPLHDLRISVIDRCNFRCNYCMPEEEFKHYKFLDPDNWLSFEEIERLVKIFVQCGVSKIRLTGGEPLIRPDLSQLIKRLSTIEKIDDLALTTNGSLLPKYAAELKKAGLKRLTVSLDSLDPKIFKKMGGKKADLTEVLEGIAAAQNAGFKAIKINVVVQRGVNDHTLIDLVRHFRGTGHVLRFIEFMDVGNHNHWSSEHVLSSQKIVQMIQSHFPLEPMTAHYDGEVASRFSYTDGQGEIGFISSVSEPFCGSCNRARLSTDGKLYTCLFAYKGMDLRTPLRKGGSDEEILQMISSTWQNREDRYSELRSKMIQTPHPPKVEMFQIGG